MSPVAEARIVGYERVPDGNACELCNLAAGQRYKSDDLMPIHDKCGCGVEPITEDQLFRPKLGERAELRSPHEYINGEWKPIQGPVRGRVAQKGKDMVLLEVGPARNPRWVSGSWLDVRKPTRAVRKKVDDDLAHGETAFMNRLSTVEVKAVDSYKGYGYKRINGQLRLGKEGGDTVRRLDVALQKGSLGSDTTLYRAFHLPGDKGIGDIFSDRAFVSTSLRRNVSERFTRKGAGGKRVLARINAPAGTRGGFLPGQAEQEFLLPRNTRFRIVAEKVEDGVRVIDMEILK